MKAFDFGEPLKERMDATPQRAASLAVNYPDLQKPAFTAGMNIFGQKDAKLLGVEGVQVKLALDRNANRFLVRLLFFVRPYVVAPFEN